MTERASGGVADVRPGRPSDAATIAALSTQVFLDTYATEGVRPDLAREAFHTCSEDAFAARMAEADRHFVLAWRAEGLIGYVEVRCSPRACPGGSFSGAELVRLYVQPRAQRGGVGRKLILEAERLSLRFALRSLWLTVWEGNERALAFYRRMGYAIVGATTYTFESRTYANHVLAKRLDAA